MIGLDTNVLIRYIVRDDKKQTAAATRLIESHCTSDDPGIVSSIVLCEIVWVLDRGYNYEKPIIVQILKTLLASEELLLEYSEYAWQAFNQFEEGTADFADYFLGLIQKHLGAEFTWTFDRQAAANSTAFKLIRT